MKNKLGVFQMYDKDGIVEDYITFLLDDLIGNLSELVIVVCGDLRPNEKNKLLKYTDRLFFRENEGYDVYAFKETILNYIGLEGLLKYEEVVLLNDTFYGPFYPFYKMFDEMDKETDIDFWGITKQAQTNEFSEHIQSYFLVVREKMLHSKDFGDFWESLNLGDFCLENLEQRYEVRFTKYFSARGFKYCAYVKDEEINGQGTNNYSHYYFSPYRLVKYYHMPVVKKKVFIDSKNVFISAGEEIYQVFKYIKEFYGYDTNMIWKDMLRKADLFDIKNCLNLNYILSIKSDCKHYSEKRSIIIAHITYDELVDECLEYIKQSPERIDICVTSYKESVLAKASEMLNKEKRNYITKKLENRGRDVAAIFVGCRDIVKRYDYICFVHDKRTTGNKGVYATGASFQSLVWENMLKSTGYIENILGLFDEESKLGLLCPPKPIHGDYSYCNVAEWTVNYELCCQLSEMAGLKVKLKQDKPPFCLSTCFWCKKEALESLWELPITNEDFPMEPCPQDGELNHALERMLVYAAQDAGYYSAIVENTEYASLDLQNREIWLRNPRFLFADRSIKIALFVGKYKHIYIYGAGIEAKKVAEIMEGLDIPVKGYIVSDKYFDSCRSTLNPLIRLQDVSTADNVGIIVGMNLDNSEEVRQVLIQKGFNNVYYFNQKEETK